MYVSRETPQETDARLRKVLAAATLTVLDGTYAFVETPISAPPALTPETLACVRDDDVWSALIPSTDEHTELFAIVRVHFADGLDNSGFVGWLASHLKATLGTGVLVVCGQNSGRGGIFDYWGCPAGLAQQVIAELERLR